MQRTLFDAASNKFDSGTRERTTAVNSPCRALNQFNAPGNHVHWKSNQFDAGMNRLDARMRWLDAAMNSRTRVGRRRLCAMNTFDSAGNEFDAGKNDDFQTSPTVRSPT